MSWWPKIKLRFPFDGALRGIGGEYEITRVLGGFGCMAYCVCANTFIGWGVIVNGKDFDIVAYCTVFPIGLTAIMGAAAGAASLKDRNVAKSKVIEETGRVPTAPPAGPPIAEGSMEESQPATGEAGEGGR